jgi:cell division protein FtsB
VKFNFRRAVLILAIFVGLAGLHLYITTQNIGLKYEVDELNQKLSELRSQNRSLGSLVAKKENLPLIERTARGKLQMVYPEKMNYVLVTKEATP